MKKVLLTLAFGSLFAVSCSSVKKAESAQTSRAEFLKMKATIAEKKPITSIILLAPLVPNVVRVPDTKYSLFILGSLELMMFIKFPVSQ